MRNQKELRYLITPGNVVASLVAVISADSAGHGQPLRPIAEDAHVERVTGARPKLLVIVVGETVRAQSWGLNGYARQTTPELAALDVVNFSNVTACGSSTEVSLPCMFSLRGRRDYDARDIKRSESLLHVLERAGIRTLWRDNQTGCKGVCEGLAFESFLHSDDPAWCDGERCLDEVMLDNLFETLDPAAGDRVIVLHQLGNHGPGYYRRYPARFRRFTPTCDTDDLGACRREEIVNAYDNAVLYTDHVLAKAIAGLDAQQGFDAGMMYVSDHGESLGENGLYLHGIPYAIAPDVQTKVPLFLWFSQRWAESYGVDRPCLRARQSAALGHDNLFSTVLGLMQVRTRAYDPELDLLSNCSNPARHF
ncbi:phosphoethanolamine transferase [Arenimonas daejeonensis]|uniref:phosphoethanolamine transferase n=1 Tax=Arenimonas daejeonensis TaxID=370777 RepID=UPI002AD5966E|nr:sulfatase-like hydrolase/transferase [Arenimonas daejeonensis]